MYPAFKRWIAPLLIPDKVRAAFTRKGRWNCRLQEPSPRLLALAQKSARDEYLVICALAHQWPQMVKALGMPELEKDPRFASARARSDNNRLIADIVEKWLKSFPSRDAAIAVLERERVPCAPVLTLNDAMAQPHLLERGTVRQVRDPQIGSFAIPGSPVRFSAWSDQSKLRAALLGEHNEKILGDVGLTNEDIAQLYAENVIVRDALLNNPAEELHSKAS
jgi:CoA:oxalate CoA-transferase